MKSLRHSGLSCGQVMGSRSPGQELADLHEAVDIEIIEYLHYFLLFLKVGEFSSFSPPHVLFLDFTKVALHVSQFKISPDYLILSLSIISCLTLDTVAPLSLRPPALRELSPNWLPLGRVKQQVSGASMISYSELCV